MRRDIFKVDQSAMAILLRVLDNKWFRRGLIAVVLIVGLIVGGRWYLGYYIDSHLYKDLGPKRYADLQRFLDSPLSIPDEWYEVEPFPDDLIELDRRFQTEWEPLYEKFKEDSYGIEDIPLAAGLKDGIPISDDQEKRFHGFLDKYSCHMDSFYRLVSHPQYEIDALNCSKACFPNPNHLLHLHLVRYQSYKACKQGRSQNWESAFQTILVAMRTAIHRPTDFFFDKDFALANLRVASLPVPILVSSCTDTDLLLRTLEELNRLVPLVRVEELLDPRVGYTISILRNLKRTELPVDFHAGMTGRDAVRQVYDYEHYYPEESGLSTEEIKRHVNESKSPMKRMQRSFVEMAFSLERHSVHAKYMDANAKARNYWSGVRSFSEGLGLQKNVEELFLDEIAHYQSMAEIGESIAAFDLARLSLAARIVELETGKKPTDITVFTRRFFPEPLTDPESGKPYQWDEVIEQFVRPGE